MTPAQAARSHIVKCIQNQPTAIIFKSDCFNISHTLFPKAPIITWQVLNSSSLRTAIPRDELELEGISTLQTWTSTPSLWELSRRRLFRVRNGSLAIVLTLWDVFAALGALFHALCELSWPL